MAAALFAGRFLVIVPVLCIAGMFVAKGRVPPAMGTAIKHQFGGLPEGRK